MPDTFTVRRSTVIAAPPERIYALIEDFHHWPAWSPWEKLDPAMKKTYGGPPKGLGATYAWQSQGKAGVGDMEIVEAGAPSRLGLKLNFLRPFPAQNRIAFTLEPAQGGTDVAWTMTGARPLMMRLMGLFFSMDKMVGKDFEEGLANLKRVTEDQASSSSS